MTNEEDIINVKVVVDDKELEELAKSRKARDIGKKIGQDISKGIVDELRTANLEKHVTDALQIKNVGNTTTGGMKRGPSSRADAAKRAEAAKPLIDAMTARQKADDKRNWDQRTQIEKDYDAAQKAIITMADRVKKSTDVGYYHPKTGKFIPTTGTQNTKSERIPTLEYGRNWYGQNRLKPTAPKGVTHTESLSKGDLSTQEWFTKLRASREFWFKNQLKDIFAKGEIDQKALAKLSPEQLAKTTNKNAPRLPGTAAKLTAAVNDLFNRPELNKWTNKLLKTAQEHPFIAIKELKEKLEEEGYEAEKIAPKKNIDAYRKWLFGSPVRPTGPSKNATYEDLLQPKRGNKTKQINDMMEREKKQKKYEMIKKFFDDAEESPQSEAINKAIEKSNIIERRANIKRSDLQRERDKIFLFGDNLLGKGLGGQAKSMRGEPNAVGIPTKKEPSNKNSAYFNDKEYEQNIAAIDAAFNKIPKGSNIVIPSAGIGTGLAKLSEKAPKTFEYLQSRLNQLGGTGSINKSMEKYWPILKRVQQDREREHVKAMIKDMDARAMKGQTKPESISEPVDEGRQRAATEDEIREMLKSDQRVAKPEEVITKSRQKPLRYPSVSEYVKKITAKMSKIPEHMGAGPGLTTKQLDALRTSQGIGKTESDDWLDINAQMEREAAKEDTSKEDISYDAELKKYKESGKLAADKAAATVPKKKKKSANLEHMIGVGVAKAKSDMERIQAKIQNPDASYKEIPGYPQPEEEPEFLNGKMNAAMGGARTIPIAQAGRSVPAFKSDVGSPAAQSAMTASLNQLGKTLQPIVNAVQQAAGPVGTGGNSFMGKPSENAPGSVGYRKFIDGNVYLSEEAANLAVREQIQKAINRQYENLAKMTGSSIPDAMSFHTKLKELLGPSQKIGNFLKEMSHAVDQSPEALEAVAREKFQRYLRGKPAEKAAMEGKPPIEQPSLQQKMFGQDYKIKLSFRDYDEFKAAADRVKQLPGWTKTATKEFERYNNIGTDVLHTMEVTGHVGGGKGVGPAIEEIRQTTGQLATEPSAVTERSQLEIGDKRLSLQQKLELGAQKLDKLNWKLVRGQMALLGIAFSMQGAIKMVTSAWTTVTKSLSSLEDIFKNIGMAIAFGPAAAKGFLRDMLGSSTKIVDSWKKFTGYQATLNSMLAYFAFKLMQDTRVIFAIDKLVEKLVVMLQDTAFLDKIFGLIANIIDALPGIVDGVVSVVTWLMQIMELPGMKDVLKWMVAFGVAAQFLMSPLAVIGGIIQFIGWAVAGLAYALGLDPLGKGWLATFAVKAGAWLWAGWTVISEFILSLLPASLQSALGALAAYLNVSIAGLFAGLVGGIALGLLGVWIIIQQKWDLGMIEIGKKVEGAAPWLMNILKTFLWPLGMIGAIAYDLMSGQADHIAGDLEAVFLQAVIAASEAIESVLRNIPFMDTLANMFANSQVVMQARVNTLAAAHRETKVPALASGGYIEQTGAAIVHKGERVIPADEVSSQNVQITNYVTATVNNKTDEKYLLEILGRKYYSGAY